LAVPDETVIRVVRPARYLDRGVRYLTEVDGRRLTWRLADVDELSVVVEAGTRLDSVSAGRGGPQRAAS